MVFELPYYSNWFLFPRSYISIYQFKDNFLIQIFCTLFNCFAFSGFFYERFVFYCIVFIRVINFPNIRLLLTTKHVASTYSVFDALYKQCNFQSHELPAPRKTSTRKTAPLKITLSVNWPRKKSSPRTLLIETCPPLDNSKCQTITVAMKDCLLK